MTAPARCTFYIRTLSAERHGKFDYELVETPNHIRGDGFLYTRVPPTVGDFLYLTRQDEDGKFATASYRVLSRTLFFPGPGEEDWPPEATAPGIEVRINYIVEAAVDPLHEAVRFLGRDPQQRRDAL